MALDRTEKLVTYGAAALAVAGLAYMVWARAQTATTVTPQGYLQATPGYPATQSYQPGSPSFTTTLPAGFTPPNDGGGITFNITNPSPPANGVSGGCGCSNSTSTTQAYGNPQSQASAFGPLAGLMSEWLSSPPDNVFAQSAYGSLKTQVGTEIYNAARIAQNAQFMQAAGITSSGP